VIAKKNKNSLAQVVEQQSLTKGEIKDMPLFYVYILVN
jgi:hypothetical protein